MRLLSPAACADEASGLLAAGWKFLNKPSTEDRARSCPTLSEVFYDAVDPAGYVSRTIQHIASHAFTPSGVRQLLETSGFKNIAMYGGFSFGPLTDSSFDMIITESPN